MGLAHTWFRIISTKFLGPYPFTTFCNCWQLTRSPWLFFSLLIRVRSLYMYIYIYKMYKRKIFTLFFLFFFLWQMHFASKISYELKLHHELGWQNLDLDPDVGASASRSIWLFLHLYPWTSEFSKYLNLHIVNFFLNSHLISIHKNLQYCCKYTTIIKAFSNKFFSNKVVFVSN